MMRVLTEDGWSLAVRHIAAQGRSRGAILGLHAMMVDQRTLDRGGDGIGSLLASRGWDVYLADFRGHGRSGPKVQKGGRWSYHDLVDYDVPALVDAVRELNGRKPLVVLGHSLGVHVTAASVGAGRCERPPDAFVNLAGGIWAPRLEPGRRAKLLKGLTFAAFRRVSRFQGFFPTRRLKIGSDDESGAYVEQLTGFWSDDYWGNERGDDYLAGMQTIEGPVLAVIGAGDWLLGWPKGLWRWTDAYGPERADKWLVGRGSGHGLDFDPGHMELVTDLACRPMWERIADWLELALPA